MSQATKELAKSAAAYPDTKSKSAALYERAVRVSPGGNSRTTVYFPPYPVYAAKALGSRVWDVDGVERLDFINNYSSLIHGHNHPKIVEAIIAQAQRLLSISLPTEEEVQLAEIVTARLPGVEQIRFCNSGTEGVMMALKAARAYTGRSKIAKVEGAYHGSGDTASVSVNPSPDKWGDPTEPASVIGGGSGQGAGVDVVILPMNDVENGRKIIRKHASELAGVIIDPLVKNLGYVPASAAFVKMLREECHAAGAMLIFDEVYSMRLGFNGAQGALGVNPDLTAMGKIIGGGLPVGAVGGRADIMTTVFDPRAHAKVSHGGTFNANPMTMAAGVAAMKLFDKPAFDRLTALGDRLRAGLREAIKIAKVPGNVGGATSMVSLFHVDANPGTYRDVVQSRRSNAQAGVRAEKFFQYMLNHGVLMGAPGFFVLSTAITEDEVDHVIETSLAALKTME
ncbi:MAG TPA: aspartate aminotransferase family protein [Rhizomicrobium sp.]|jgi:glutamate-1-semialdehyde 2,1-aminomutase|nr:aspartate aminotransferase family protein [Rhizomicrobium sp.]